MTSRLKTAGAVAMLAIGLAAASSTLAQEGSTKGGGMMGRDGMMGDGMMSGGMMGGMMGSMMQMMDHCARMMQGTAGSGGSGQPNDQWRRGPEHGH